MIITFLATEIAFYNVFDLVSTRKLLNKPELSYRTLTEEEMTPEPEKITEMMISFNLLVIAVEILSKSIL